MLKLKNVSKYYYQNGLVAKGITNINLELHLGEFVVITGESGSGKSTLLNVLSGLDSYEDGEMYINGEETSHYTEEDYLKYRRSYVSNIFQNFNLINSYTVYENIELAFLMNGYKRREVKNRVNELINKVGLVKFKNTKASKLSGGQKQKVAIARALANDTPIIVADEPTGSLDSENSKNILKILHDIAQDKLVIVVTHNKSEIEEYATRLIRMHDGKILENKVIKDINLDETLQSKEVGDLKFTSKLRLGFRNAFNLPVKFVLMVAIFLIMITTIISNYGGFKALLYEEMEGFSEYYNNVSDKRIIIKKENKEYFTLEDYQNINKISGIDYIVPEDLLNDYVLFLTSDNTYLDGSIYLQDIEHVDVGRLPKKENEVVIIGNKDNYFLSQYDILNKEFIIENDGYKLKIVGILYDDSYDSYNTDFYVNKELREELNIYQYKMYNNVEITLDNINYDYINIIPSDKVKTGEALSNIGLLSVKNGKITNQNIYQDTNLVLNNIKLASTEDIKKLINDTYDINYLGEVILINNEDYVNLFKLENYQSSIFVNDVSNLNKVEDKLHEEGYTTLSLREVKNDEENLVRAIFKIIRLIFTVILLVSVFFISYFVIRIIYKSRNSYYTTLRTLGSTRRVCINILMQELVVLATFSYGLFLALIILVKKKIFTSLYLENIVKYISVGNYLVIYLILIGLSLAIAYRYGRKIFAKSIIKTYKENE